MQQTPHRPVLIVIAGPNGSGKTTITSKILRHEWLEDAVYVNPDQVAQDKYGDWNSIEAVTKAPTGVENVQIILKAIDKKRGIECDYHSYYKKIMVTRLQM